MSNSQFLRKIVELIKCERLLERHGKVALALALTAGAEGVWLWMQLPHLAK